MGPDQNASPKARAPADPLLARENFYFFSSAISETASDFSSPPLGSTPAMADLENDWDRGGPARPDRRNATQVADPPVIGVGIGIALTLAIAVGIGLGFVRAGHPSPTLNGAAAAPLETQSAPAMGTPQPPSTTPDSPPPPVKPGGPGCVWRLESPAIRARHYADGSGSHGDRQPQGGTQTEPRT